MRKVLGLSLSIALGLTALAAVPAAAGDYVGNLVPCVGTYENVTADNVKVEEFGECRLVDSKVQGNVQANKATRVELIDTDVAGNVQVKKTGVLRVWGYKTIGGNLKVKDVDTAWIRVGLIEGNCEIKEVDSLLLFNVLVVAGNRKGDCIPVPE